MGACNTPPTSITRVIVPYMVAVGQTVQASVGGRSQNFWERWALNIRGVSDSRRNSPLPPCVIMQNLADLGPQ